MSKLKVSLKTEWFSILMIVVSLGLAVYFYQNFPEQIASHWNFRGEVDGYSSKIFGVLFGPGLLTIMYVMFLFLPLLDPKRERYENFAGIYRIFKNLILGVFFVVYILTGLYNLGYPIAIGLVIPIIIGLMMMIMGNYLGKIQNNWFVGIRTPWTLSSENVWNKTHRFGGKCFILFGLIIIVSPFLPELAAMIAFFGGVALLVFGTLIYSYIIYRQEGKQ